MKSAEEELELKATAAKAISRRLAYLSTEVKNKALGNIANDLLAKKEGILAANRQDHDEASTAGMNAAMLDRLLITEDRLKTMAQDVMAVATLPDPIGEMSEMRTMPNGLLIGKKRVPLGVIGAIYESRPNVTIDISSLCLKSGNALILRGGKESIHSNSALAKLAQQAIARAGIPQDAVQFVTNTDRRLVDRLLRMGKYIDMIVPRGSAGLIEFVKENTVIPVIAGGIGVCHTYIDKSADVEKAVAIVFNAKVQRPTVCNALDTMLIHKDIAEGYLPKAATELAKANVEMRCDELSFSIIGQHSNLKPVKATGKDWGKEFLAPIIAVKVVASLEEALEHIACYGSGHSEAIITENYSAAMRFLNEADAACVYINASTRFTDGAQFGLGAELGISTQKMHARGPIGLKEITSYKWIIFGSGQIRL